jgi:hypothetical protein
LAAAGFKLERPDNFFSQCNDFKKLVDMALAGREASGLQPFGAMRPLQQQYLATTCISQSETGKIAVNCEHTGKDEAVLSEKLRSWDTAAKTCLRGWERTAWENETNYVSPEGAVEVRLSKVSRDLVINAAIRRLASR